MKRSLHFILITFFVTSVSIAQQDNRSYSTLPTFVNSPMTPEASSLGKYTDIPVGLSTGTISPSIPIYTIDLKALKIPISIDYHSSGIKVNDLASSVGLGWSLNAGGLVSMSVVGRNDLEPNGWLTSSWLIPQDSTVLKESWVDDLNWELDNQERQMRDMSEGVFDSQPDLFYYNYPGDSGKFFFDSQQNIRTVPFSKKSITMNTTECVILDENGNQFIYEEIENTYTSFTDYNRPEGTHPQSNFSFYLTKIISRYGEEVTFTYSMEYYSFKNQRSETRYSLWDDQYGCAATQPNPHYSESTTTVYHPRLIKISSNKGHEVSFGYGATRTDIETYSLEDFTASAMLSKITVHDGEEVNATFNLYHSYFGNATSSDPDAKRLKLDSIKSAGGQTFRFSYDNPSGLPHRLSYNQDHWGYYNGNVGNNTLLPIDTENGFTNGAIRSVNEMYAQYGILKRIEYPTGGFMDIEYEGNDYYTNGVNEKTGGLRVRKVIQSSNQSPVKETNYFYTMENDVNKSSGILLFSPTYTYTHRWEAPSESESYNYDCYCTGQTVLPLPSMGGFTSVRYGNVIEQIDSGTETGKTITEFGGNSFAEGYYGYPFGPPVIYDWSAHNPTKITELKFNGQEFQPVKETRYLYKDAFGPDQLNQPNETAVRGAKVMLYLGPVYNRSTGAPLRGPEYRVTYYNYFSSWYYLKELEETLFTEDGVVTNARKYYYDNPSHGFNTREVIGNISANSSDSIVVLKKYPMDYNSTVRTLFQRGKVDNIDP